MRKLFFLFLTSSIIFLSSCSKDFLQVNAIVEKNCTGSYLKIENKYYYVCNQSIISSYTSGQAISVSYEVLEGCAGMTTPDCYLNFNYESIIEIKEII
ncbi:hypothetical protein [Nubsella zeaxanthinifaciens]|uniref:hypothetical protein n=1 Tax=Nubsella zeaxanthinifaciens TaxID=392412 RepID=UPI000DE1F638|nr:hypothetical protein [Nubsella zeaxanthinifaciens]